MRSFVRTMRVSLGCLGTLWLCLCGPGAATAWSLPPIPLSVTIHGQFGAGSSGATANNDTDLSTLTNETASLVYTGSDAMILLTPGSAEMISLGTLSTATGTPRAIPMSGATLSLIIIVHEPDTTPSVDALQASITGSIDDLGGPVVLTWQPAELAFATTECLPKTVRVTIDPTLTVVSGSPETDVMAKVAVDYDTPFLPGDVDGDGLLTPIDVVRSTMIASGIDEGLCEEIERGDLDGNGRLDMTDTVGIARAVNGLA